MDVGGSIFLIFILVFILGILSLISAKRFLIVLKWKKSFSIKNNYNKAMVDILFDIQQKYVNEILKKK